MHILLCLPYTPPSAVIKYLGGNALLFQKIKQSVKASAAKGGIPAQNAGRAVLNHRTKYVNLFIC